MEEREVRMEETKEKWGDRDREGGGRRDKGRKRTSSQDETTIFYNLLVYSGLVVQ